MNSKKPSRKQMHSSCDDIGPDDGLDPRTFFQESTHKRTNRKALQLCRQIAQTLGSVLAWESGDDLLRSLAVLSVEPAPDSTRVLVTVCMQTAADVGQVLERLHRSSGKFRTEVAASIHRKRVPELVFRVLGSGEVNA
jgi:ribosome-binding factor A